MAGTGAAVRREVGAFTITLGNPARRCAGNDQNAPPSTQSRVEGAARLESSKLYR